MQISSVLFCESSVGAFKLLLSHPHLTYLSHIMIASMAKPGKCVGLVMQHRTD